MEFASLAYFDAPFIDGMTYDAPFLFWISKKNLTGVDYAKFHKNLIAGYILNEFKCIWTFNIRLLKVPALFPDVVSNGYVIQRTA